MAHCLSCDSDAIVDLTSGKHSSVTKFSCAYCRMLMMLGKNKFSKRHFEILFLLFFSRKQALTFQAICIKYQSCFLGKIRKNTKFVVCGIRPGDRGLCYTEFGLANSRTGILVFKIKLHFSRFPANDANGACSYTEDRTPDHLRKRLVH